MKLWLLRHARVSIAAGLCYGASEVAADLQHTRAAAQAVAPVLPRQVPLRVSALGRARQLAHAVRALRPDLLGPLVDTRLNEMHFGRWELQPWEAIPRRAFDDWMADFAHHRFGGVESAQQVIERVADALESQRAAGEAVWVTHAGVIRAVQYVAAHGRAAIGQASQWPRDAPEPGGWLALDV